VAELKVWNIDLADSYPDVSDDEKLVLKFILKNKDGNGRASRYVL
jgi:hypothetical protein